MDKALSVIGPKLATYGSIKYDQVVDSVDSPISYPYGKYELSVVGTEFKTQICELVIDLYGERQGSGIVDLEQLRSSIWKGLDYWTHTDADISLSTRQLTNNQLPEPDKEVARRQLTFQILLEEA